MNGYCECGCGGKTNISSRSNKKFNHIKGEHFRFIVGHAMNGKNMEKSPSWKGGRYINDAGYVMVYNPNHKKAQKNGYVREHIIIAEKALGKPLLEGAQVHHYGDISDNTKIVICEDQNYHFYLHIRKRALEECGDANKRKCKFCQQYDYLKNLHIIYQSKLGHGWNIYHRECEQGYRRERRLKCS